MSRKQIITYVIIIAALTPSSVWGGHTPPTCHDPAVTGHDTITLQNVSSVCYTVCNSVGKWYTGKWDTPWEAKCGGHGACFCIE